MFLTDFSCFFSVSWLRACRTIPDDTSAVSGCRASNSRQMVGCRLSTRCCTKHSSRTYYWRYVCFKSMVCFETSSCKQKNYRCGLHWIVVSVYYASTCMLMLDATPAHFAIRACRVLTVNISCMNQVYSSLLVCNRCNLGFMLSRSVNDSNFIFIDRLVHFRLVIVIISIIDGQPVTCTRILC